MLRPIPTVWFELVVLRRDLGKVMDCVARTRVVQLEARGPTAGALRAAREALAADQTRHEALRTRFGGHWPAPGLQTPESDADLIDRFRVAVDRLDAWAGKAAGIVDALETARSEIAELLLLDDLFSAAKDRNPDLAQLPHVGPYMAAFVAYAPPGTERPETPDSTAADMADGSENSFFLALGPGDAIRDVAARAEAQGWRRIEIPRWLPSDTARATAEIEARLKRNRLICETGERDLERLHDEFLLSDALGTIEQVEWLLGCARDIDETVRLARITGWALVPELDRLEEALEGCAVFHVLAFPPPPAEVDPPVVLFNPDWARRFEALTRMIGMPGAGEADPTLVVALVAPLLFGFMFGDVGQGFVLLVAGLTLRRRIPALAILIPGGVMSMIFGFLFGSIFGREDVIPPLWLHPLEEPILLLGISVGAGALILLTGLVLRAMQMRWQGRWSDWLIRDAGMALSYVGLLSAVFWTGPGLAIAGMGALWFVAGTTLVEGVSAAARAVGEFVETMLQLLVNTVSFARAGAFALAHAGLSVAIVGLADAAGPVFYWVVLALGNLFVLALEGLVVGIQTTRLLLFEFFIRFLTGGGRQFRPLDPPGHLQSA